MSYNKEVQSIYKKKVKQFKVQYNLQDEHEAIRLDEYLLENNISANSYLKRLIKEDLDRKKYFINDL